MLDLAGPGQALALGHAPGVGGGLQQQFPGLGAYLAEAFRGGPGGLAAAGDAEIAELRVGGGLQHLHPRPVRLELFGDDHGLAGPHALADLGARGPNGDRAIGIDAEHAIRFEARGGRGGDRGRLQVQGQVEGEGEAAHGLEEVAAVAHGATLFPAARWMASRIRR